MRFRQLISYIRVCELGSITRAAAELNIAQPALGLQIRGLEHEFDAILIERSSRGVEITPQGELVLAWARSIISQTEGLRKQLKVRNSMDSGPYLTLGLTSSLTSLIGSSVIAAASRELPMLRLKLVEGLSQFLAEWVDEERIDIALGFGTYEIPSVQFQPLMHERLFYLSERSDITAPIELAEVLQRPLAVPDKQNSIRQVVEAAARSIDLPVIGNYELASLQAARDIARKGIAGAIVPFGGVADHLQADDINARLIISPPLTRTLYVMQKHMRPASDIETRLLMMVKKALHQAILNCQHKDAYRLIDEASDT